MRFQSRRQFLGQLIVNIYPNIYAPIEISFSLISYLVLYFLCWNLFNGKIFF